MRDRHSESVFASVEATGPARSREVVEKLLAHPLLDEGRALAEADAVLVSLMGGKDLTMAEVNRVMEQISRQCEHAQIIMGAAVDETLKNRLSVTVIAAKQCPVAIELPPLETSGDSAEQVIARGATTRPGSAVAAIAVVHAWSSANRWWPAARHSRAETGSQNAPDAVAAGDHFQGPV